MRILYLPNAYSQQRQREKRAHIYPVLLAMQAQYYKNKGHDVYWNNNDYPGIEKFYDKVIHEPEGIPFLDLPHADRGFTRFWEFQNNGNFKHLPGTYILSANGCWHGRCTFCVEQKQKWEVRPVGDIIHELYKIQKLGIREVFDDSGTFPIDTWLESFCNWKIDENLESITMGCNMRLVDIDYAMMKQAGFRMLLFGLESANQFTLDKIQKGTKVEDVKYIIKAAKAGLEPHIAVMFGYPWETEEDALNTLRVVHYLLRKGYAKTAQASLYKPTENCKGYEDGEPNVKHQRYTSRIYYAALHLDFWWNKLRGIRRLDDLKYLAKQIKVGINGIQKSNR